MELSELKVKSMKTIEITTENGESEIGVVTMENKEDGIKVVISGNTENLNFTDVKAGDTVMVRILNNQKSLKEGS